MKFSGKEGTAPNKASPSKKKASAAKETNNLILKHILKNAFDFKGKINTKFVLGIVLKDINEQINKYSIKLNGITDPHDFFVLCF